MQSRDVSRRVANELAARQHGAISTPQAVSFAGLSHAQVEFLVRTGLWDRAARGVFTVAGSPATWERELMVAVLTVSPNARVSHAALARLTGVGRPYFRQAAPEITVPHGCKARAAKGLGVIVHTAHDMQDASRYKGIPVTTGVR
jgi:hypothetical protein